MYVFDADPDDLFFCVGCKEYRRNDSFGENDSVLIDGVCQFVCGACYAASGILEARR